MPRAYNKVDHDTRVHAITLWLAGEPCTRIGPEFDVHPTTISYWIWNGRHIEELIEALILLYQSEVPLSSKRAYIKDMFIFSFLVDEHIIDPNKMLPAHLTYDTTPGTKRSRLLLKRKE